ncbi:CHAT domain-containing tetratricopeptide repeat protein [Agriterribacter sp.]|uniref:CHAT domain-containing protein n=1 Tax=Agriterribacter sp. TaxID=2821509 RepID=UPI002B9FF9D3|nr:CHAT domain-containing tetratricopeptide repeat protein [Agriterribacter sp.]HRP54564.1 CHAT domain-containing protein [Agriterribacter sp.]
MKHILLHILFCVLCCIEVNGQYAPGDYAKAQLALIHYKLDSSLHYIAQAKKYYTASQKPDSLALTLALETLVVWEKGTTTKAIEKADSAFRTVLNKTPAKSNGRVALNSIAGSLYASKYQFDSAAIYYNRALNAADTLRPQLPLVVLYMNLSKMEMLKENTVKAEHYYNKAYQTLQTVDPGDETTLTDLLITRTQYFIVGGNYNAALESATKAGELIKKNLHPGNPKAAKNFANLSAICYYLGRYEEALTYRQKALNVYLQTNMQDISSSAPFYVTYYNMGQLYYYLHEHTLAANYLHKALNIGANIYGRQNLGMVNILVQFGSVQQKLKNHDQAKVYIEEAYHIQKTLNPTDYPALAYIESFYGDVFADEKKHDSAAHYYNASIAHYGKAGEALSYYALYTRANLASAYAATGRSAAALQVQKDVLKKFRKNFPLLKQPVVEFLSDISLTYLETQQTDSAQLYADSAILMQTEFKTLPANPSAWLTRLPFSFRVSKHVQIMLDILYKKYHQSKEKKHLLGIIETIDAYSAYISENIYKLRTQSSLIEQSESNKQIYASGIDACWILSNIESKQQYVEKAFMFAEQGKALLLKLASNNVMIDDALQDEDAVVKKDIALRKEISSLNEQYLNAEAGADSLLRLLTGVIETYRTFQDSLQKAGDPYFYKRYSAANYPLKEIRETLLSGGSTLIEFALTERYLYTFVITQDSIHAIQSNKDIVNSIYGIENPQTLTLRGFRDSAYKLYSNLIKPVEHWFAGNKLIIVPDADLYYLNFETLVTDTTGSAFTSLKYLIHDYNISYLLSANVAVQLKKHDRQPERKSKALLFAPVFTDSMKRAYKNQRVAPEYDSSYFSLFRQPFALQAVRNIYGLMPADMFLEHQALESNFKRSAAQYRILHLGTHAQVSDIDPLQSRLFFAKEADTIAPGDDGNLYAYEIYSMQLKAELAVLFACETGRGAVHSGEGVMSLAHSFMFAGCPGVVMSLWKIDEKTNAQIVTDFYKHLKKGHTKSEALRKAKLSFLENNHGELANPFYWGGLCVIGDDAALYSTGNRLYWFMGVVIAALALVYFFRRIS